MKTENLKPEAEFSATRRRVIFLVAALAYILSQFYRSFLTVIVDDLTRDLGIGPKEFGALGAAWFFTFSLSQFLVGALLDKYGPRYTMAGMMGFAVIGAALFASATDQNMALIAMGLIGLGCAPILMGMFYFFAKTEEPSKFAQLSSLFLGVGMVGSLASAAPLAFFVVELGWRNAIWLMAGLTALATIGVGLVLRDPPADPPSAGGLFGDLIALLHLPALWPILAMSFFISMPVFTERALWVGPFFGEVYGFSVLERGNYVLVLALAMTASAFLAGPVANRIAPKTVVLCSVSLCGAAFTLLALWPALPASGAILLLCIAGLFGVSYAVLVAHARLFMPGHVIGRGITFINFLSIGGTGLAQLASGHAVAGMKAAGFSPMETYSGLHLAFGMICLFAALIYARAPKTPDKQSV